MKPVVTAILSHPALYLGPRLVKPPIVHTAGLLRRIGAGITTTDWAWIGDMSRAAALLPAERRGLGRHALARHGDLPRPLVRGAADPARPHARPAEGEGAVRRARSSSTRALHFWNDPPLSDGTQYALRTFANRALADAGNASWKQQQYPVLVQNALRQLVAMSPDLQTA